MWIRLLLYGELLQRRLLIFKSSSSFWQESSSFYFEAYFEGKKELFEGLP